MESFIEKIPFIFPSFVSLNPTWIAYSSSGRACKCRSPKARRELAEAEITGTRILTQIEKDWFMA